MGVKFLTQGNNAKAAAAPVRVRTLDLSGGSQPPRLPICAFNFKCYKSGKCGLVGLQNGSSGTLFFY
jgi:hypothetical protein